MSDEEYEYDYGSDAEYNYGSDGAMDEDNVAQDESIEIENSFYEADDYKADNPKKAIEYFEKVVSLESAKGDEVKWRFKALLNLVILYFGQHNNDKMIESYNCMLQFISQVTRNECTDAINHILDSITTGTDIQVLSAVYEITLEALKSANNERLWFTTNIKLGKLYLDSKRFNDLDRMITMLKSSCINKDGAEDLNKASFLLEIYCLEIQFCSLTDNVLRMKAVYPKTLNLNSAISDPRIMGVIREEGGKMYMAQGLWKEAYTELNEAFRAYQEAGNTRAKTCLKYVVVASMLSLSDINPFAAREAKVFSEDAEIMAMGDLRASLEANDLRRFERTLRNKANRIADEPFIMKYIQPLRRRMHEQVLISITKPYRRVTLAFLAQELSLTASEVEALVVTLILDGKLDGRINQQKNYLSMGTACEGGDFPVSSSQHNASEAAKLQALRQLAVKLENISGGFSGDYA